MDKMRDPESVKAQYSNGDKLNTRISLHTKYSVNKKGFGNWIYEQYDFFNGCSVLELGCGTGDMWIDKILGLGTKSRLILSDFSQGMVDEVQEKFHSYRNVSFEQINIEEIPYPNHSFDVVIANMMLYHVPNLEKALAEVTRVLKPNGKFYSATFGENGIAKYLTENLAQYGFHQQIKSSFTLQNGAVLLEEHFNNVVEEDYLDALEITDTNDLLNYIFSMASMADIKIDRESLYRFFEAKKDLNGKIRIPKEYGLFISQN